MEENRIMPFDDIKGYNGDGHWIELAPGMTWNAKAHPVWHLAQISRLRIGWKDLFEDGHEIAHVQTNDNGYAMFSTSTYGIVWRVWEYEPTDEQRKAAEWNA